ncbi:TolB family protein [Cohnella sp. GCM10020058]|uniref:TolB family protein n=1 Tax=Cohnella sp. GCM10020058 TaxID=3317330 RepID=UPI00363897DC
MKANVIKIAVAVPALLMTLAACSDNQAGNREVIKEPGKTITVIDDAGKEVGTPDISVGKIDPHAHVAITDWLDEETVIAIKANEALGKMSLAELADSYPRSLYRYNLGTKKYESLKEQKKVNLGGGELSPDKKHLLYSEFSLGDPIYRVLDLATMESFPITGGPTAGAMSAHWTDDGKVIGAAYSGGAYTASTDGKIEAVKGVPAEGLIIVRQMNGKIYYNSNADETLHMADPATGTQTNLNLARVSDVVPSPDGKQMLVLQYNDSKKTLTMFDADGKNPKVIAEGTELEGVSWSPDQRLIAYSLKGAALGTNVMGLYVYDLLADKSSSVAVNVENPQTVWSPSGQAFAYTVWDGKEFNSSVVHLTLGMK